MNTVIKLYPYDTALIGKYPKKADIVLVELYSDDAAFTVQLPDLFDISDNKFVFHNRGSNDVTCSSMNNQDINSSGTYSITIVAGETINMMSNNRDRLIFHGSTRWL